MTLKNFYITLSDDGSNFYYKTNTPSDFTVKFDPSLNFSEGCWKVCLSSIQYSSTIDNLSDEFILLWNGSDYEKINMPPWCCPNIDVLIDHINNKFKQLNCPFSKYEKNNFLNTPLTKHSPDASLYSEFGLTDIPSHSESNEEFCITHRKNTYYQNQPTSYNRKRRAADTPPSDAPNFNPEDFEESHENDNKIPSTVPKSNETPPNFNPEDFKESHEDDNKIPSAVPKSNENVNEPPTRDLSELNKRQQEKLNKLNKAIAEEQSEAETPTPTFTKINTLQQALNDYNSYSPPLTQINPNDIRHESKFNIKLIKNKLNNIEFNCESSDVDIAFSTDLQNILGFQSHTELTAENFEIRKFFRNYLFHYSQQTAFLFDTPFQTLATNDRTIKTQNSYLNYIKFVITQVLKINTIDVWNDFTHNYSTDPSIWPLNTKWVKFFEPTEFSAYIKLIEKYNPPVKFYPTDTTHPLGIYSPPQTKHAISQYRGMVISYYMLQKLFNDKPKSITTSNIPPHINHPNDIFLVYSNIVTPNLVNETTMPLLAIIQAKKDTLHYDTIKHELINLQYRNCVSKENINSIRVYITSMTGKPVKFLRGPTFIQLHFLQTPT